MAAILLHDDEVGIRPVPVHRRVLGLWDTFVLWADLGISFLVMVVGTFLLPGLGLKQALLAILVGAVIGNVLLGIGGAVGAEVRVPQMVLLRAPLGLRGSYLPTALNILQLLGWATFEVIVMAQAADVLMREVFGLRSLYHLWVAFFTALTLVLALSGPIRVTRLLKVSIVWLVLISTLWITGSLLVNYDIGAILSQPGDGSMSFWLAVDLVVALPISWFPLVADYNRFARDTRAAFWGTAAGYFVPQVWFYALGSLLVLAVNVASDPNAPISPMLTAIAGLTAGWAALLILLIDETDEAFANVYSTALSIENLFPWLSHRLLIVAICAVVLLAGWTIPLAEYESFLLLIGSAFVPLLGVLAADYYVLRGRRYEVQELYEPRGRYWYTGGVNWLAVVVWLLGAALYLAIAGIHVKGLNVDGLAPQLGATLPSFIVTFVLYTVLGRLALRRPMTVMDRL
ncbi:MAG: putative hydroxymethylpyrimidine transporter CytX [Chloroflexota bacterium]